MKKNNKMGLFLISLFTVSLSTSIYAKSTKKVPMECNSKNYLSYIYDSVKTFELFNETGKGCNLEGVDFSKSKVDFKRANFLFAKLSRANFSGLTLNSVNFLGAELIGAKMLGVTVLGGDWTGVDLTGAIMSELEPKSSRSTFIGVRFHGTILDEAVVRGATLRDLNFGESFIDAADFTGVTMLRVDFSGISLYQTKFNGATTYDTNFHRAYLEEAEFVGAKLKGLTIMARADLTNVWFRGTELKGIYFYENTFLWTDFDAADLRGAAFDQLGIDEEISLKGAKFNKESRFPKGFKPRERGMVEVGKKGK